MCKSLNTTRTGKLRVRVAACLNFYINNLPRISYFKATFSYLVLVYYILFRTFSFH